MKVIDCENIARKVKDSVRDRIKVLGRTPTLSVIQVGDDYGSNIYIRQKKKACDEVGVEMIHAKLSETISEVELRDILVSHSNLSDAVILQLPACGMEKCVEYIWWKKDVDCLRNQSLGMLAKGKAIFVPCTPAGIMRILEHEGVEVDGKEVCIIGRSNIVGKPLAMMMTNSNATVTLCHSHTRNLSEIARRADILVSDVGKIGFITGDMVKPGAVVVDVGINRKEDGKVAGDVDVGSVCDIAGAITPVPHGVGPMTVAMLMENIVIAAEGNFG